MTPTRPGPDPELRPEEASFVRQVAEAYAPAPPSPQRRVAFRNALERRLERERRGRWWPALGGLAVAGIALALVLTLGPEPSPSHKATPEAVTPPGLALAVAGEPEEDALLALLSSSADADSDADELPDDYQAIASLFLGEV